MRSKQKRIGITRLRLGLGFALVGAAVIFSGPAGGGKSPHLMIKQIVITSNNWVEIHAEGIPGTAFLVEFSHDLESWIPWQIPPEDSIQGVAKRFKFASTEIGDPAVYILDKRGNAVVTQVHSFAQRQSFFRLQQVVLMPPASLSGPPFTPP